MVFGTWNSSVTFLMLQLDDENLKLGSDMSFLNNELINESYMKYKWSMR